jgi:hypothetical protein
MSKLIDSNLKVHANLVDAYTKQTLERSYNLLLNNQDVINIENLVHDYLMAKVEKQEQYNQEMYKKVRTAEYVVERIKYYLVYAGTKESAKMRLTRKELDYSLSLLDEVESVKVNEWINNNGGYQGVLAPEWVTQ